MPDLREIARAGYAAWAREDYERAVEYFAEDFVFEEDPAFPEPGVYRGTDGFIAYARAFLDSWQSFELDVEEILVRGERVLGLVHWRLTGRGSGVPVEVAIAHLWTFRDGKAVHMRGYVDRDAARTALEEDSP